MKIMLTMNKSHFIIENMKKNEYSIFLFVGCFMSSLFMNLNDSIQNQMYSTVLIEFNIMYELLDILNMSGVLPRILVKS